MKNKHKGFGSYLREKRKAAGLSQQSVAKSLGYSSPQFISNLERGTCPIPLNRAKQFIGLYRISEDEFVERYLNEQESILRGHLHAESSMTTSVNSAAAANANANSASGGAQAPLQDHSSSNHYATPSHTAATSDGLANPPVVDRSASSLKDEASRGYLND